METTDTLMGEIRPYWFLIENPENQIIIKS